jgi:hypothetical protein
MFFAHEIAGSLGIPAVVIPVAMIILRIVLRGIRR